MMILRHRSFYRRILLAPQVHYNRSCCRRLISDQQKDSDIFREQMKDLQEEREMLYGFTEEETHAWQQQGTQIDSSHVDAMNQIREEAKREQQLSLEQDTTTATTNAHSSQQQNSFSHVSEDGQEVSMVDVGHKSNTQRVARAQSKVVFPPEVMMAFEQSNGELIGPKGPIFSTAQLAGIMAAKKTSDLIPLCHPLPLDKVDIRIQLEGNVATITCECRVTFKTGVEMEALTGASVAALTIYDMVKAVSHRVQIQETVLLSKTGGKRIV